MSGRILIVDDYPGVCEVLEAGLAKKGFQVAWRASGQDAFDLLCKEDFDAVVTDLTMRGMTGLDLCVRVVEDRPDVPVVVITAFGSLHAATAAENSRVIASLAGPGRSQAARSAKVAGLPSLIAQSSDCVT